METRTDGVVSDRGIAHLGLQGRGGPDWLLVAALSSN